METDIKRKRRIKMWVEVIIFLLFCLILFMSYKYDVAATEDELKVCKETLKEYAGIINTDIKNEYNEIINFSMPNS